MLQGSLSDLREPESIIVDESGAQGRLAQPSDIPGQPAVPVRVGDVLEINDRRAVVVGIAKGTPSFMGQPGIYTTYSRAKPFALSARKTLAFVLAQAREGEDAALVARRITAQTGLAAWTAEEFKEKSLLYMIKNTNVLINFGFVVLIGFVIGAAVTGQIFYNFTLDNLRYFGVFKAMGAGPGLLVGMILAQALSVGLIGFGLGAGVTAAFGILMKGGHGPSMSLSWQLLLGSGGAVLLIVLAAALVSIRKVLRLEAAVVFKG
jgi:putative ABC transport system permease protein